MSVGFTDVSVRGKIRRLPSSPIENGRIIVKGRFLKTAEIFDEFWLEERSLPDPLTALAQCRAITPRPDLFTFAQRVPDTEPRHEFFRAWDNAAVIPLTSYDRWLGKQITPAARRNIKSAARKGVRVEVAEYDDAYVRGISAIYNESPIRQGRRFWHYGKPLDAVAAENGTYADRSMFLAAFVDDEMVGYLKLVWDRHTAAVMQLLSKMAHYDKRPNNALLAEAVRQCCGRNISHLLYEKFVYGTTENSLTEFKRSNGFVRFDVPRYYVPLTRKGAGALRLGLHTTPHDRLPPWVTRGWTDLRARWYRVMKPHC